MDKNSIIGLLLIGAIMIGFTIYNKPDREALEKAKIEQSKNDSLSKIVESKNEIKKNQDSNIIKSQSDTLQNDSIQNNIRNQNFGNFANATLPNNSKDITVETDLFQVNINPKGAIIDQITLKKYKTWDHKPLKLLSSDSSLFSIDFRNQNLTLSTSDLFFINNSNQSSYVISGKDSISFILTSKSLTGESVNFKFTFFGNDYKVHNTIFFENIVNNESLTINWNQLAPRQEKNLSNERNNTTIYYDNIENEVDKINPLTIEKYTSDKGLQWIGFKQQFFTSVFIPEKPIQSGAIIETINSGSDSTTKYMSAKFNVSTSSKVNNSLNYSWYFGPTHYATLQKAGNDLQKQIPLGWGIFGWVNKLIVIPAFNFLGQFNLGYGLVILLLTLYIKILLLAFQFKSYMSQAKMRVLKPEMDELNEKYKEDDPIKKQQAVMELYRSAGVNPLGGCLPMLFQIPILFALFNFFPNAIELRQEGFLWADDLSTYDSIVNLPFTIPFYGNHISLFALMMTVSTIIYTRMNNQLSAGSSQMMPQLKWMMYLMPVIFLFVLNSYAAGLNYYYFLANIITFAQQFAFRKLVDDSKIHAKIQENKMKPKKAKASSFQQKLEEMAKSKGIKPSQK